MENARDAFGRTLSTQEARATRRRHRPPPPQRSRRRGQPGPILQLLSAGRADSLPAMAPPTSVAPDLPRRNPLGRNTVGTSSSSQTRDNRRNARHVRTKRIRSEFFWSPQVCGHRRLRDRSRHQQRPHQQRPHQQRRLHLMTAVTDIEPREDALDLLERSIAD